MNENNVSFNNTNENNSKEIQNLIESIQTKLCEESTQKDSKVDDNTENNVNSNNNNIDFANILKNIDLTKLMGMMGNNNNTNNEQNSNFNIDPNTIFKIQKVINRLNSTNPKKNLLLSLKPFLRKSRQEKLNEYITMLTLIDAFEAFNSKGSDNNV